MQTALVQAFEPLLTNWISMLRMCICVFYHVQSEIDTYCIASQGTFFHLCYPLSTVAEHLRRPADKDGKTPHHVELTW